MHSYKKSLVIVWADLHRFNDENDVTYVDHIGYLIEIFGIVDFNTGLKFVQEAKEEYE